MEFSLRVTSLFTKSFSSPSVAFSLEARDLG